MNDKIDPIDRHELIENSDPADEPIDNTEFSDHSDHLELFEFWGNEQDAKARLGVKAHPGPVEGAQP